jgi:SAM-dependent methyltransferase
VFGSNPLTKRQREAYYDSPLRWHQIHRQVPAASLAIWHSQLEFAASELDHGSLILEIGSGPGYLLDLLQKQGHMVSGYDLSKAACKHAKKEFGITIHDAKKTNLLDLKHEKGYDLVILRHVLEHVPDLNQIIGQAAALTTPSGSVFVETSAWDILDQSCQAFPVFEHVNYFNLSNIAELFSNHGFSLQRKQLLVYPAESEKPYRNLRILARKAPSSNLLSKSHIKRNSEDDWLSYIKQRNFNSSMNQAAAKLDGFLLTEAGSETKFALFAASNETAHLLEHSLLLETSKVTAIFDNNPAKWGMEIAGIKVKPPKDMKKENPAYLIIGSSRFLKDILRELPQLLSEPLLVINPFGQDKCRPEKILPTFTR